MGLSTQIYLVFLLCSVVGYVLHVIEQCLFAEISSENSYLDDSASSLPGYLSRTSLALDVCNPSTKMVNNAIAALDSCEVSGSNCILVIALNN